MQNSFQQAGRICELQLMLKFPLELLLLLQKEPSFGADTDEEDDEKDDNLLPM